MKILHVCFSCFYIDHRNYQENELIRAHVKMGYNVQVLASTRVINETYEVRFLAPNKYISADGATVERLAYKWGSYSVSRRLGIFAEFKGRLLNFDPDIIIFHGVSSLELLTCARYVQKYPKKKLIVDNHADKINSARNIFSKYILHKFIFANQLKFCLRNVSRVYYISELTKLFLTDLYGLSDQKLAFLPLGGHPLERDQHLKLRQRVRTELSIGAEDLVFLQSGKLNHSKGLLGTLLAFTRRARKTDRLLIAGSILQDVHGEAIKLIEHDNRIQYLGWKLPEELEAVMHASDVYLQPKSQSSSMQTAMCCGCIPVLEDLSGHEFYCKNKGFLVNGSDDLEEVIDSLSCNNDLVVKLKKICAEFARTELNYIELAKRILE